MKTPEEIALIGGGILLSSGLVFGLKSGAASELPNVSRSVDTALQGKKNADSSSSSSSDSANAANQAAAQQKQQAFENSFDGKYQQAQKDSLITGTWGTSKYYIDKDNNMHVGSGDLQGKLSDLLASKHTLITTLNFDQKVVAPQDSSSLLSGTSGQASTEGQLTTINGLNNIDTSKVTNMYLMLSKHTSLRNIDLSSWDTSHTTNMQALFIDDNQLNNVNINDLNVENVQNTSWMFEGDYSLKDINISNWSPSNLNDMTQMFGGDASLAHLNMQNLNTRNTNMYYIFGADWNGTPVNSLKELDLGNDTLLKGEVGIPRSNWDSGSRTIFTDELNNGQSHPGTWTKQ